MNTQILFRTESAIKEQASRRAKKDGIALQKVLHSLFAAYAAGSIGVDLSIRISPDLIDHEEEGIPNDLYLARKADFERGENIVSWQDVRARLAKNETVA